MTSALLVQVFQVFLFNQLCNECSNMRQSNFTPFIVYLLGLTIFSLTTAEFMVSGMMPSLADALNVSVGKIGYLISLYAFGMAIGGPLLTVLLLALGISHKSSLLWLLALYITGGTLAAVATDYTVMAVGRVVMGVASAACFGVALTICAEMVAPEVRGRAASIVLGGLMLAPVFGVPATIMIEQAFGWRFSFWAVIALALMCSIFIAVWLTPSGRQNGFSLGVEFRFLVNRHLWAAYATSALIIGATFAAFSYISPIFIEMTGISAKAIPLLLAVYGTANVIGNLLIGRLADRHTMAVLATGLGVLVLALVTFAHFVHDPILSIGAFLTIGLTGVSLNPAMVARVMRAATPTALVNTMHASAITGGLALGAWMGGVGIDIGYGLRAPLWIGAVLAALGLLSLAPYWKQRHR